MSEADRSFTVGIALEDSRIHRVELRIALARLEEGQRALQAAQPSRHEFDSQEGPDPAKANAGFLLGVQQAMDIQAVLRGIRNVLRTLESRNRRNEGNDQLAAAEVEFRESYPQAWNLRDILEHLPEYVVGKGKLQENGEMPSDHHVPNLFYSSVKDPSSEITFLFNFDKQKLEVKAAARKAIEIADLLVQIGEVRAD